MILLLLLIALFGASCEWLGGAQNTFAPEGEVAQKQRDLLVYWILGPAAIIFVLVEAAAVYAMIRFRRRSEDDPLPEQVHGNNRLELAWTIAPAILLVVIAVPIVIGIFQIGRDPSGDALRVTVYAQQFNWQFDYPEFTDTRGEPLRSNGELHVPVGREIGVDLIARDVIHSFWVPKLAGTLDVVPGRTNRMWFKADSEGVHSGQCKEFCGLGHAKMRFTVIAQSSKDFQAWVDEQLAEQNARIEGGSRGG